MPAHMIELRKEVEKYMDLSDPAHGSSEIIIDFTVFRAAVRDCKIVGPREVVAAALEIDHAASLKHLETFQSSGITRLFTRTKIQS